MARWSAPEMRMRPPVATAAMAKDATSMRSAIGRWVAPESRSTPSTTILRSVSIWMSAPIFWRKRTVSTISGSMAALWITVVPSARQAAWMAFSVAPTLG